MKPLGKGIRKDFPILQRKVKGKRLVYLDSAATSQKPAKVIAAISDAYSKYNSNIHRGVYSLSEKATQMHESAREKIAKFIDAPSPRNIIFVKNTTEALNTIAYAISPHLPQNNFHPILTSKMEHHSNFVPWQQLCSRQKRKLEFIPFSLDSQISDTNLKQMDLKFSPALVAISHTSNVLGTINDVASICSYAHKNWDCPVVVDAAQSAPHLPLNVKEMGVDFLAFSAHKMLGPYIGALYISDKWIGKIQPVFFGGGMVGKVGSYSSTWAKIPMRFEAGTPDLAGAAGFGAAIDYLEKKGMKNIQLHECKLTKYAFGRLSEIPGINIFGPVDWEKKCGIISFNIEGMHPHDLGTLLDRKGIAIRAGHHCAQPLMELLGVGATARASFYLYNDIEDVDALADGISYAKKIFKV